ncbi:MAG TPA: hypothetical protein PKL31_11715 [Fulvivirga sp.]|nr:hypothetical protein [Fulvivirga sp.]
MNKHLITLLSIILAFNSIEAKPKLESIFDKPETFIKILLNQRDINGHRVISEDSLNQLLVEYKSNKDSTNIFFCHLALSSVNAEIDKAEMLHQIIKAYSFIPHNAKARLLPYLKLTEATSYYRLGKYNAVLEKTSDLQTIFKQQKRGDLLIITKLYTSLCLVLLNKNETEFSTGNIYDEINALTTIDEEAKALLTLHAININGIIMLVQNKLQEARALFREGIEKASELNERKLLIGFHGNLSNIYLLNNDYDVAIRYAMLDFNYSKKEDDKRSMFGLAGIIAESYFMLGKLDSTNKYVDLIIKLSPHSSEPYFIRHNQNFVYDFYQKTGKTKKLADISKYFDQIQDSLAHVRTEQDYDILRSQIELEDAQSKIDQLKKINHLEYLKNQASQKYNVALTVGIVIVLLFVLFIYKNLSVQKKQNLLLEKKSAKIKNQNEELQAQQEDIMNQANRILELNTLLEQEVDERTKELIHKNKKLSEYAFYNSHNIRGPLARILGLIHLWEFGNIRLDEKEAVLSEIQASAKELDEMVKTVNRMLE